MGTGMSMFNVFDNGMSCGPFPYGREKMQKVHSVSNVDGASTEEIEGRISDPDEYLWVQSPSFRDYCLVHTDSEGSIKNVHAAVKKDEKKKSRSSKSEEAILVCTDEVCIMKKSRSTDPASVNKERRERKFKDVLPHRPAGMKNIFKVNGNGNVPAKIVKASDNY